MGLRLSLRSLTSCPPTHGKRGEAGQFVWTIERGYSFGKELGSRLAGAPLGELALQANILPLEDDNMPTSFLGRTICTFPGAVGTGP
jgi:hypothetical protein